MPKLSQTNKQTNKTNKHRMATFSLTRGAIYDIFHGGKQVCSPSTIRIIHKAQNGFADSAAWAETGWDRDETMIKLNWPVDI